MCFDAFAIGGVSICPFVYCNYVKILKNAVIHSFMLTSIASNLPPPSRRQEAVSLGEEGKLNRLRDCVERLPPPHYRTLAFLMRHLSKMADQAHVTNMHARNLAIVWAPNLLRSKALELGTKPSTAPDGQFSRDNRCT